MDLEPEFTFAPLHGLALIGPLLLARIGIPLLLNREALRRLGYTPRLEAGARWLVPVYGVTEGLLLIYPFFLTIKADSAWFVAGVPLMVAGWALVALSALEFSRSAGWLDGGIYRYSRNPMYIGFFLYFTGVGLVAVSWLYVLLAVVEQVALYRFIRAEERWCEGEYGEPYRRYTREVRRYFGRRGA